MNLSTILHILFSKGVIKSFSRTLPILLIGLLATTIAQAADITHNINGGSLTIPGNSTDNYIVTGTGVVTSNNIIINAGYKGTVRLKDVNIERSSGGSCINVIGQNDLLNSTPITIVNIVLEGTNNLKYTGSSYCGLQVNQGAQINISAIDPANNASGILFSKSTNKTPGAASGTNEGGAGIGAPTSAGSQGTSVIYKPDGSIYTNNGKTAGGNIIISSGTITAWGGHGAGIGGGYTTYYNGLIIIYGGIIDSRAGRHAAGIGSGCPNGSGVQQYFADMSTVVAVPPAEITCYGTVSGNDQQAILGLTGTRRITYINDPNKPVITVHTIDNEPNANIYLDLTETPDLESIFQIAGINSIAEIRYDLKKVRVGRTNASGIMTFNGRFEQNTTFFTDASSSNPANLGRPYLPVKKTVLAEETIVLPLLDMGIALTDYPSIPLDLGYSAAQAKQNAYRLKIEYNDSNPMTDVKFSLQGGGANFTGMTFYASDNTTVIPAPTTLSQGNTYYVQVPIVQGKEIGIYADVLLINGTWKSQALQAPIRKIVDQRVIFDDTNTNTYIKMTASENKFIVEHPTTKTVTLNLNINHDQLPVPYDHLDVAAKYLITTEANYDAALAATPLNAWTNMNIPAAENTNTATTVSFSGKPVGTYYIHWYAVSGIVYGHSKNVTDPPLTNGGYGSYKIVPQLQVGTITATNPYVCFGKIPAKITGTLPTGGSGNFSYQWQISTNNSTWTNISGANAQDYTPTAALTVSPTYFRRMDTDNQLTMSTPTVSVKIDQYDELKGGTIGTAQSICFDSQPAQLTGTASTGGDGNYTYQWQYSSDGTTNWTNITTNGTSASYQPSKLTSTTYYRRETKDGASCGTVYSNIIKIAVYDKLTAGSVGSNQTICYNSTPSVLTSTTAGSGGDGNIKYQWQSSSDGTTNWTNIMTNGTSATYAPEALTSTIYYRREVKDGASCGTEYSNVLEVKVHPQVVTGTIKGNPFVCQGIVPLPIQGDVSSGGSSAANIKYQWQSSANGTSGWTNISGAVNKDYTPTSPLASNTYFRRVTTDNFCNTFEHYSNVFEIKVVSLPTTLYWKTDSGTDNNWNNPNNWVDGAGIQLGMVPLVCTDVVICGGATKYPSLDASTITTIYGDPVCKNITFEYGAEVAYQHKLMYEKAFVQYNWGYYTGTPANNSQPNNNGSSTTCSMNKRDVWYALAAPLKNMASGDFSFGGYPITWQGGFNIPDPVTGGTVGVDAGDFSKVYARNDIDLTETNNAIAIKIPTYKTGTVGCDKQHHMDGLKGIIEFPYFENETKAQFYPTHSYDKYSLESKFFYFDTKTLQLIYSPVGRMKRGEESYRFVYENASNTADKINLNGTEVLGYEQSVSKQLASSQKIMVGNPFMASINSKRFLDANNINSASPKIKENEGYYIFNSTTQTWENKPFSATNNITPQQAFLVTLADGITTTKLMYPLEGTYALTGPTFRGLSMILPEGSSLYLKASSSTEKAGDYSILDISEPEEQYNIRKMIYTEGHVVPETFFIATDGKDFNLIQAYESGVREVGIGVKCSDTDGMISFSFENANEFYSATGACPLLIDKVTNVRQNLTKNNTYYFKQRAVDVKNRYIDADRFVLRLASPVEIMNSENTDISIVYYQGILDISATDIIKEISVYDLQGRSVHSNNHVGTISYSKTLNLPQGVYVVKVKTDNGKTKVERVMAQ